MFGGEIGADGFDGNRMLHRMSGNGAASEDDDFVAAAGPALCRGWDDESLDGWLVGARLAVGVTVKPESSAALRDSEVGDSGRRAPPGETGDGVADSNEIND